MILYELRRRNVLQVLAAYLAGGWFLMKTGEVIIPTLGGPEWTFRALVLMLIAGCPLAGLFAWLFELTPDGLRLQSGLDREGVATVPAGPALTIFSSLAIAMVAGISAFSYFSGESGLEPDLANLAAPPNSIAVLPFANMSPDADNEYFADGLSEELMDMLSNIQQLKVTGRTSVFSLKGSGDDLTTIGQKLNVANILEGSVRKSGPSVRVSVKLVTARDGYQLWSETYDRTLKDVFSLQEDIASKVVDALKITLLQDQLGINPAAAGVDPQAYDLYLQAKFALNRRDKADVEEAIALLQRALAIDSKFASAYATLAKAHGVSALRGYAPQQTGLENAVLEANRALALDQNLVEAYYVLGMTALWLDRDVQAAEQLFGQALKINPNHGGALNGASIAALMLTRFDTAVELSERALERDPLSMSANLNFALIQHRAGMLGEAAETLENTIALNPETPQLPSTLAIVLVDMGEAERALQMLEQETSADWRNVRAPIVFHALGREEDAAQAATVAIAEQGNAWAFHIAETLARMGRTEQALDWLEKADEEHDAALMEISSTTSLRGLHDQPRFIALLNKLGFPPSPVARSD